VIERGGVIGDLFTVSVIILARSRYVILLDVRLLLPPKLSHEDVLPD
jgi:hypothetical protein